MTGPRSSASSATEPPGPAASMALRARLSTAARRLGSSAIRSVATAGRASLTSEGNTGVLTGRLKQRGDVMKQSNQVAGRMRPVFESTEGQEASNLLFHQGELAQGHGHAGVVRASSQRFR